MTIPAQIAKLIDEAIREGGGWPIDAEARNHGAIALMGTIGSIWMLRSDGSLWDADAYSGKSLEPLEPRFHLMAIAAGVERYPWLLELLPKRPVDAPDCEICKGAGTRPPDHTPRFPNHEGVGGFLCEHCNALGWRLQL